MVYIIQQMINDRWQLIGSLKQQANFSYFHLISSAGIARVITKSLFKLEIIAQNKDNSTRYHCCIIYES
jgi:hypothetical protein